jgi:plastocyanin
VISKLLRLSVLMLTLGMVAAACSSNKSSTPTTSSPSSSPSAEESSGTLTINGEKANDHGTKDVSGAADADVEMDDEFYFEPTVLKGTPGQTLKLDLENSGNLQHNFSIEAQTISQDVAPQEKQEVTVTFPQSGIVEFFCRFHRSSGMIGELSL